MASNQGENEQAFRTVAISLDSDQADWAVQRSIVACGVRVGIRTNEPKVLDRLLSLAPPIWKPSLSPRVERQFSLMVGTRRGRKNGRSLHHLYEDRQLVASSTDMDSILEILQTQLKAYLAEMARRRVFIHAGAVGWRGHMIIIPGRSFSGKTSLVAELVRAGATYYSDECAVMDKRGRAHPYTAPLALREPGSFKQKNCHAQELGGSNGVKPLPVGLVIVSQYKSGERWRPHTLSAGQAMLELLANTIPARRKPEAVMATLEKIVSQALVLKGARGEAQETVRMILER
ncbi:MAG: hypothetical protein WBV94_29535 [Blastocatellia bacterium]